MAPRSRSAHRGVQPEAAFQHGILRKEGRSNAGGAAGGQMVTIMTPAGQSEQSISGALEAQQNDESAASTTVSVDQEVIRNAFAFFLSFSGSANAAGGGGDSAAAGAAAAAVPRTPASIRPSDKITHANLQAVLAFFHASTKLFLGGTSGPGKEGAITFAAAQGLLLQHSSGSGKAKQKGMVSAGDIAAVPFGDIFQILACHGDGKISRADFEKLLHFLGSPDVSPTARVCSKLFAMFDKDHDGFIGACDLLEIT